MAGTSVAVRVGLKAYQWAAQSEQSKAYQLDRMLAAQMVAMMAATKESVTAC